MFIATSCDKSDIVNADETANSGQKDLYAVPINIADEVALTFSIKSDTLDTGSKNLRKGNGKEKKSTETVVDEEGTPLYHIINFKESGFVVVSADYRAIPIIAFNDTGELIYERDKGINGLAVWFEQSKEQIKDIKKSNKDVEKVIEKAWKEYLEDGFIVPTNKKVRPSNTNCQEWYQYGQFMCQNSTTTYGPHLTTFWGQRRVSTALLSNAKDCDWCGRYLAGCGPVAIGQVARYLRRFDTNPYNYASMPNSTENFDCNTFTPGQNEIARLIRDIGLSANSNYDYFGTCNTLTWPWQIGSGLNGSGVNGNNIIMVTHQPSNYQTLKNELIAGFPVIFVGYDPYDWGVFQNWHIWVCDGYKEQVYSEFNCNTLSCDTFGYAYLHMNWGWSGNSNGYFGFASFAAGGSNYTNGLAFYRNIRV